jgi:hypothetical protein
MSRCSLSSLSARSESSMVLNNPKQYHANSEQLLATVINVIINKLAYLTSLFPTFLTHIRIAHVCLLV